jgi:hypothetical protein
MTRLPELMTTRMIAEETGLSEREVRNLCRRLPKVKTPQRKVYVKRRDVLAALNGRMAS